MVKANNMEMKMGFSCKGSGSGINLRSGATNNLDTVDYLKKYMTALQEKLKKLDAILLEGKAPLVRFFNPGLPKVEIISFLTSHGIKPYPDLVTLYEWHNGVDTVYNHFDEEVDLIPFGSLFNMHEMLQVRETFREWAEDDFDNLDIYVPFLGTGESDMFILNTVTGQVLAYQPMIQIVGELAFHSIETLIDCILKCFEVGAYQIDEEKGIIIDMEEYHAVREKHLHTDTL